MLPEVDTVTDEAGRITPLEDVLMNSAQSSPAITPSFITKTSTSCITSNATDETFRNVFLDTGFRAKMIVEECYALRGRVRTLNSRVKGPVGVDTDRNTALPMVFLLGNHSSGKSSFINYVLKSKIQECGVAPTDDKFTVIAGGDEDVDKDGNSLIGWFCRWICIIVELLINICR